MYFSIARGADFCAHLEQYHVFVVISLKLFIYVQKIVQNVGCVKRFAQLKKLFPIVKRENAIIAIVALKFAPKMQ